MMRSVLALAMLSFLVTLPPAGASDEPGDLTCYHMSSQEEFLESGEPMMYTGKWDGKDATFTFIPQGIVLALDLNDTLTLDVQQQSAEPKSKIQGYTGTWLITWVCKAVEEIIDCVDDILRLDPRCQGP